MLKVTLRNLLARKVRLVLSASAIVIGIAFVAGTLVFTDTMGRSFDGIVKGSTSDVVVRPAKKSGWSDGSSQLDTRTISAATVHELASTPGVARVDGTVESQGLHVVGSDGKLIGGTGAPTLSFNYNDAPSITGKPSVSITRGHQPRGPHEVALDAKTVKMAGYHLGDTVPMVSSEGRPRLTARLVGIAEFGGGGLAGATLVLWDTHTAQELFLHGRDAYTSVALTAKPDVSQAQLAANAQKLLPSGDEAVTGDRVAKETQDAVGKALNFINIFLLVFAAISLVVGSFLIINTFSILVAQRSRELALLRALGASRRQVNRSVLLEAAAVGVVGTSIGL
ncbi:MAG TPA: ABC transporter permease, partial [Marmoricola sp.]